MEIPRIVAAWVRIAQSMAERLDDEVALDVVRAAAYQ